MPRKGPTESDRDEAIRGLLGGLRKGTELPDLALSLESLHPRDNTFPGEVFMGVAIKLWTSPASGNEACRTKNF